MTSVNVLKIETTIDANQQSTVDFCVRSLPCEYLRENCGVTRTEDAIYIISNSKRIGVDGSVRARGIEFWMSPVVFTDGDEPIEGLEGREEQFLDCLAHCTPFGSIKAAA